MDTTYLYPNAAAPTQAIFIDPDKCVGCCRCANVCRTQTIMPNPEQGRPPIVVYPDECWFCACCVEACPTDALQMRFPISQRTFFKRKATGEQFRIGQKNPPLQTYFEKPVGESRRERIC